VRNEVCQYAPKQYNVPCLWGASSYILVQGQGVIYDMVCNSTLIGRSSEHVSAQSEWERTHDVRVAVGLVVRLHG
jgi:hypothetical protein